MDPIADMLIRIKNAVRAQKKSVSIPHSEIKFQIAMVLMQKGYLEDVQRKTRKIGTRMAKSIEAVIAYKDGEPVMQDIKRMSKVSRRAYIKVADLFPVRNGRGIAIVSTSNGILTDGAARKAGIGGEIIAEVW
ncbi:MAG: 30S ribosomal protein S8 [Patescibacteria group bacterium]